MGVPLAHIVEEIGGGVPGGAPFKAVQTGGPSGGCIPYDLKDTPVDYDSLTKAGSMMGSGGMIVMDDKRLRGGRGLATSWQILGGGILRQVPALPPGPHPHARDTGRTSAAGKGTEQDLDDHGQPGQGGIADGRPVRPGRQRPQPGADHHPLLPRRIPGPYQRAEMSGRAFARSSSPTASIADACTGCMTCARACPQGAISGRKRRNPMSSTRSMCIRCGICLESCKFDAVRVS